MVRPHPSTTQLVAQMIQRDELARLVVARRKRRSRLLLPARIAALLFSVRAGLPGRPGAIGWPGIVPRLRGRRTQL